MSLDESKIMEELSCLREEVRRLRKALNQQAPRLSILLQRRGFKIYKKEPMECILIPTKRYLKVYYRMFHKYSFRLFLRDVIKHQHLITLEKVIRYAAPSVTRQYLNCMVAMKLIKKNEQTYSLTSGPIKSFGETLEWYVAEVFKREFASEAAWGIKFKRSGVGGDYDVIAACEGALLYVEVKSSPPKQIYDNEIAAFLDRVDDLSPEIAIFLMDTELRMKDKIVPMFEKELANRHSNANHTLRLKRELFQVQNNIFIMNAKESIIRNIETVVHWYYTKQI
ncbi:MAG TPA: hypothetical protein VLX29_02530 [Nitrospirota bacterium]|nr:hypothetical protein [Nitrospirota bacterium]